MKRLIVVRHAKSSWDFPDLDDFNRPLNDRGKKNAPEMAQRFLELHLKPDLILTSGAKRAYATAVHFYQKLNLPSHILKTDNRLFHASANEITKVIREQQEDVSTLMLFGHNPGMTDFTNRVGDMQIENLPTCGIYGILWAEPWKEFGKTKGKTFLYDFPKNRGSFIF